MHPLVSVIITTCNRSKMLTECLNSVFESSYKLIEVIVIDDNSKDNTEAVVKSYLPKVRYLKNEKSEYMIHSRNTGSFEAKGKYLLYIDDDNIIDSEMISNLVVVIEGDEKIAVVGPMMYYNCERNRVWWAQTKISRFSARTYFPFRNMMRSEIKDELCETDGIPNVFMIRKDLFERLGRFDESYIDTWTEGDFGALVQKNGYTEVRVRNAETFHQVTPREFEGLTARSIGDNPVKAYTTIMNRYKWVGRNFTFWNKIGFLFFWSWLILAYYFYSAYKIKKYENIPIYIKAALRGLPLVFCK